jgi:squalene-hopene/tetraprenyl-beta-curcumene cyclase
MSANARRISAAIILLSGIIMLSRCVETSAAESANSRASIASAAPNAKVAGWDRKGAAAYLDSREGWWADWPRASRDHDTFCISCHTAVPYALARPALRQALAEQAPSANERRLVDNVTKRVRLWNQVAPFYSDADRGQYKTAESRGTESVLNALVLISNDAASGRASNDAQNRQLSDDARKAFDNMWAEQQTAGDKKGAWQWLRFRNEPWEADDSGYYGATLAAVAIGTAPGDYQARPEIQTNLKALREYLTRESAAQTAINRVDLLWASTKLRGLLNREQQQTIIAEVLAKQQADGGWSLSSLSGAWKRNDGTPQETKSDGYATGFVTLVLQQAGVSRENVELKRGLAWLVNNQSKTDGLWPAYSLNKNEAHHISPDTARFMSDAATAYAVLALTEADQN